MRKSFIAVFAAASVMLACGTTQAAETQQDNHNVTCKKPPEPPKDKDGKPLPPPDGKNQPVDKDGKPLPPPDGKKPPVDKNGKPLPPPDGCQPPKDSKASN